MQRQRGTPNQHLSPQALAFCAAEHLASIWMQGDTQPAGQAGQPVDAEHFNRLQHDTSTASNLLSHFDDWEAIVQQAGQAGGGGGREAVNASSGATVVNADVIREAVQDFLQRQVPASSTQTMMNGSALVSTVN